MSTRALYTFVGTMTPAWTDHTTGKRHKSRRDHSWNVYVHHDGYPTGAANKFHAALEAAWKLPRYEADEFACAFIAMQKLHRQIEQRNLCMELDAMFVPSPADPNVFEAVDEIRYTSLRKELKTVTEHARDYTGGGPRLMPQGKPLRVAEKNCADIAYRYELFQNDGRELIVRAFTIKGGFGSNEPFGDELIFTGNLASFREWADNYEKKLAAA